MTSEIEAVQNRLAQIEQRNRVLTGMITIVFLVLCSGLLVAWSQAKPADEPLRVRSLIIEDANGQPRILMGSPAPDRNVGGNPRTGIIINDATGARPPAHWVQWRGSHPSASMKKAHVRLAWND